MNLQTINCYEPYQEHPNGNVKYYVTNPEDTQYQSFFILDIDSKVNPVLAYQTIQKIRKDLDINLFNYHYVKTPNNGYHFYFNYTEDIKKNFNKIGPNKNIDIIVNGKVPIPGEKYILKGEYVLINDLPLEDIPFKLLEYLNVLTVNQIESSNEYKYTFKITLDQMKLFCKKYHDLDQSEKNWSNWNIILRYIKLKFYDDSSVLLNILHNKQQYKNDDVFSKYKNIEINNKVITEKAFLKYSRTINFIFKNKNGNQINSNLNKFFLKMYYSYIKPNGKISVKEIKEFHKSSKFEGKYSHFRNLFIDFIGKQFNLEYSINYSYSSGLYIFSPFKTKAIIYDKPKITVNPIDMSYIDKINYIIKKEQISSITEINKVIISKYRKQLKISVRTPDIIKKIESIIGENMKKDNETPIEIKKFDIFDEAISMINELCFNVEETKPLAEVIEFDKWIKEVKERDNIKSDQEEEMDKYLETKLDEHGPFYDPMKTINKKE